MLYSFLDWDSHYHFVDLMEGFHVLLDMGNRFGGLGCGILQNLKDDYGNKAVFSFPLLPLFGSEKMDMKSVKRSQANATFTLSSLHSNSSLIMPLSLDSGWVANKARKELTRCMVSKLIRFYHPKKTTIPVRTI